MLAHPEVLGAFTSLEGAKFRHDGNTVCFHSLSILRWVIFAMGLSNER
jgi:hypothetical protein